MSAGRSRRFGPEHTKPAASATVAGHSGGIRFFLRRLYFRSRFSVDFRV